MTIEIKQMSMANFQKMHNELLGEDGLENGIIIVSLSSSLSIKEIKEMPFREVTELMNRAAEVNGFTIKGAEKNLSETSISSEPCTLHTDSEKQSENCSEE